MQFSISLLLGLTRRLMAFRVLVRVAIAGRIAERNSDAGQLWSWDCVGALSQRATVTRIIKSWSAWVRMLPPQGHTCHTVLRQTSGEDARFSDSAGHTLSYTTRALGSSLIQVELLRRRTEISDEVARNGIAIAKQTAP